MAEVNNVNGVNSPEQTRNRTRIINPDGTVNRQPNMSVFTQAADVLPVTDSATESPGTAGSSESPSCRDMFSRSAIELKGTYGKNQISTADAPTVSVESRAEWTAESQTAKNTADVVADLTYNAVKGPAEVAITTAQAAEGQVISDAKPSSERVASAFDILVANSVDDPETPVDETSREYLAEINRYYAVKDADGSIVYMNKAQYTEYLKKQEETKNAQAALDTIEKTHNNALENNKNQYDAELWAQDQVATGTDAHNALTDKEVNANIQVNLGETKDTGLIVEIGYNPGGDANIMAGVDQRFLSADERDEFGIQVKGGMNTNGPGLLGLGAQWNHALTDDLSLSVRVDALGALKHQSENFGEVKAESWQSGIVYGGVLGLNYSPTRSISLTGSVDYRNSFFKNSATVNGTEKYVAESNGGNGALTLGAKGEVELGDSGFNLLAGVSDQINLNNGAQNWGGYFGFGFKID